MSTTEIIPTNAPVDKLELERGTKHLSVRSHKIGDILRCIRGLASGCGGERARQANANFIERKTMTDNAVGTLKKEICVMAEAVDISCALVLPKKSQPHIAS
jgi:hypothetical protein